MTRIKSAESILIIISLLSFVISVISQDVNTTITIPLNKTLTYLDKELYSTFIKLNHSSTIQINFSEIETDLYFILFQVHTQFERIMLYNGNPDKSEVNGTNVGLVSILKINHTSVPADTFFIQNPNNVAVRIYISVHGYKWQDPIPGGCNLEWTPPISPYLKVRTLSDYITVEAEAPSVDKDCNLINAAGHTFYMMYQSEMSFDTDVYFAGIRKMMTLKNIITYGKELSATEWVSRRMLSAYSGVSVVFVAVARNYSNDSLYSVYVPGHSYGCPDVNKDGCMFTDDFASAMLCTGLLFIGLFVSFLGHRFFKTEMFLSGFFAGFIITYFLVLLIDTSIGTHALVAASVLSGIFFGAIWLLFWWLYGIPVIAVLLPTLNTGFICAAIFYYRLPAIAYLENDLNFWVVYIIIMVVSATALAFVSYSASILCSAFLGGFCTMFAVDFYLGSNLKYIIINSVRRAVVENFSRAVIAPPIMAPEIFVIILWIVVSTLGWVFQHWHNRGRPPFPPPPRSTRPVVPEPTTYGAVTDYTRVYPYIQGVGSRDQWSGPPITPTASTERTPLLAAEDDPS